MKHSTAHDIIVALSVSILIFVSGGCKKNSDRCENLMIKLPDDDQMLVPDTIKDYLVFQLGSYWVYENTYDNAKDCVYVSVGNCIINDSTYTGCNFDTGKEESKTIPMERCTTSYASSVYPYSFSDIIYTQGSSNYLAITRNSGTSDAYDFLFDQNSLNTYAHTYLKSMQIDSTIYTDVLWLEPKISFIYNSSVGQDLMIYYFAKNVGLIKREKTNSPEEDWK
ncbi:MAG: hypothetical protein COA57_14145 [Flavobacteriales bacterium]|nr:MAG: hypothetical protein COA57_14145 [Flavobacteriales bacterium]